MTRDTLLRSLLALDATRTVSVEFVKVGDGSLRQMRCQVTGERKPDLILVWDMDKLAWRSFWAASVVRVDFGGGWVKVD